MVLLKNKIVGLLDAMNIVRHPINRNDRMGALHKAWGFIFSNFIIGDYIEFLCVEG